jgi:hypothetical protein
LETLGKRDDIVHGSLDANVRYCTWSRATPIDDGEPRAHHPGIPSQTCPAYRRPFAFLERLCPSTVNDH